MQIKSKGTMEAKFLKKKAEKSIKRGHEIAKTMSLFSHLNKISYTIGFDKYSQTCTF